MARMTEEEANALDEEITKFRRCAYTLSLYKRRAFIQGVTFAQSYLHDLCSSIRLSLLPHFAVTIYK